MFCNSLWAGKQRQVEGFWIGGGIVGRKAGVGFEPTNTGFAIRSLSPLGYPANCPIVIWRQAVKGRDGISSGREVQGPERREPRPVGPVSVRGLSTSAEKLPRLSL